MQDLLSPQAFAEFLGGQGDPNYLPSLHELLGGRGDPNILPSLHELLGGRGDPNSLPSLHELLGGQGDPNNLPSLHAFSEFLEGLGGTMMSDISGKLNTYLILIIIYRI